jgi:hypothetical protein
MGEQVAQFLGLLGCLVTITVMKTMTAMIMVLNLGTVGSVTKWCLIQTLSVYL